MQSKCRHRTDCTIISTHPHTHPHTHYTPPTYCSPGGNCCRLCHTLTHARAPTTHTHTLTRPHAHAHTHHIHPCILYSKWQLLQATLHTLTHTYAYPPTHTHTHMRTRPHTHTHTHRWCGPCKDLGPVLESVATQESVDLAKVNIDSFTELSMEYGVSAVPTVVAISNGKVVDQFVGGQNKDFVKNFIKKQL